MNSALLAGPERGSITIRVVEMRPNEAVESVVARAETAMYEQRRHRG